ncbi:MAG: hypothetical protein NTX75_16175 [Proteobacteria bacterium]|nr:hypothetical protein [Pseudomonadota bacterium]
MKIVTMLMLAVCFTFCTATIIFCAEETNPPEVKSPEAKPPEKPPEDKVTGNASMAVLNRYIFRGYEIGKSGLVFQPSLSASYKGFSATFWGNIDTNQRNTTTAAFNAREEGKKGWDETDLTLSYTYTIQKLSLTGGYIYYNLKYAEDTEEFFLSLAYDILTKPTLSIYQDVNAYPGTYISLSFAHSLPVYKDVTLDLGASFGYELGQGGFWKTYERSTGGYTGSKYQTLHDGMVKAGFTMPVTKAFSIQPIVQYYFPLSGDASRTMGYDTNGNKIAYNHNGYVPNSFVGGVNFAFNF